MENHGIHKGSVVFNVLEDVKQDDEIVAFLKGPISFEDVIAVERVVPGDRFDQSLEVQIKAIDQSAPGLLYLTLDDP